MELKNFNGLSYWIYTPIKAGEGKPLVVFFHGVGVLGVQSLVQKIISRYIKLCIQHFGAGNNRRIRKVYWNGALITMIAGGLLGGLCYSFGEPLLSIYISNSPTSIDFGMVRLQYIGLTYFLCGLMEVAQGAVRGMGISFSPMLISLVGICGMRIGWLYTVFEHHRSLDMLFVSYPISWMLVFISVSVLFFIALRKRERMALLKKERTV